ncbi:MAG: helix-turn-helix domain-containing protein [Oscillospiraceae bacterium]
MEYLTRKQAMEYLRVGNTQMWKLTNERRIAFYQSRPNARMMFSEADLNRYMEGTRVAPQEVKAYATLRKRRA